MLHGTQGADVIILGFQMQDASGNSTLGENPTTFHVPSTTKTIFLLGSCNVYIELNHKSLHQMMALVVDGKPLLGSRRMKVRSSSNAAQWLTRKRHVKSCAAVAFQDDPVAELEIPVVLLPGGCVVVMDLIPSWKNLAPEAEHSHRNTPQNNFSHSWLSLYMYLFICIQYTHIYICM